MHINAPKVKFFALVGLVQKIADAVEKLLPSK